MIDNKKFVKEINNIYSSSEKAKKIALAEIEKIDEKYRKMAEEEKKKLNDLVYGLDSVLEYYGALLNPTDAQETVEEVADESVVEEEVPSADEQVVDTVYPENNVEDNEDNVFKDVEGSTEESVEGFAQQEVEEQTVTENAWPVEDADVEEEAKANHDDINDEWPMPEDWK